VTTSKAGLPVSGQIHLQITLGVLDCDFVYHRFDAMPSLVISGGLSSA